jgi:hexosaminidase
MNRKQCFRLAPVTLLLLLLCACGQTTVNEYNIIPLPNQMTPQQGRFELKNKLVISTAGCTPEVGAIADSLTARIGLTSGILLQRSDDTTAPIRFETVDGLPKEGYKLSVTPQQILLQASQPNGFFYGVETLYQLLPPAVFGNARATGNDWSVPAVEIEDAPRFGYRGLMLDVCRHFAPLDYIYKFIDRLAMQKMNTFHWHLTDDQGWRIEIKRYPKLQEISSQRKETLIDYYYTDYPQQFDGTPHGGYYTQEQIKQVVAYAASKYITVIPEIELPGHAVAAIAAYPELSCRPDSVYQVEGRWGVHDAVYCPKEETFTFLENVLDEVMELFPSSYIHIGGDECPKTAWQKCPHCQALIKKLGYKDDTTPNPVDGAKHTKEEKLQSYFVTRIEKYLNSKGRNIIGWDEILEGGLAPNATVMSWRGVQGGITAANAGHDAIMTPSPYAYLDAYQEDPRVAPTTIGNWNTLKKTYNYNPVPDSENDLVKKHIIGIQGNIWAEYMKNTDRVDYQAFPRAVALAETGWTQNNRKNWADFCRRMVTEFQRFDAMGIKACRNFFDVNIHTHVYDNVLKVHLETFYPDATIYYTTDGSEPTAKSNLYTEPFAWEGNIDLRAVAYKDGKPVGRVSERELYANLISGKKYTTVPRVGWIKGDTFDENDVWGNDSTTLGLTNGKRGYIQHFTPWCSFGTSRTDSLVVTVDMEKPTLVSRLVFGSLYNNAYRVLPVGAAKALVSQDGKAYTEIGTAKYTHEYPDHGKRMYTDTLECTPTEGRYLQVILYNGGKLRNGIDCAKSGTEPFATTDLFIDEIEAY